MTVSERYRFDTKDWPRTIQRLDAAFAGQWAPDLENIDPATRTYAYFAGAGIDRTTGLLIWGLGGTVVCPDNALSIVQRDPLTLAVTAATTCPWPQIPMAVVRCASGVMTRFVDARDGVLGRAHVPPGGSSGDLLTKLSGTEEDYDWAAPPAAIPQVILYLTQHGCVGDGSTDDSAAIQALINANPSNAILDGEGKSYKVNTGLTVPNGSVRLSLQNGTLVLGGDIVGLQGVNAAALVLFFTLDNVKIDATGHSTTGRRAIDFTSFAQSRFQSVWVVGVDGKTDCFYGTKNTGGSAPYYNRFVQCYMGALRIGFNFDDAGSIDTGCNSDSVVDCRIQPGSGRIGVKVSRYSQLIRVRATVFESVGGIGIETDGKNTNIDGCWFESMTTGINITANATKTWLGPNYWSSCGTDLADATTGETTDIVPDVASKIAIAGHAATSVIGRSAGSSGDAADLAAASDGYVLRRLGGVLAFGPLTVGAGVGIFPDVPPDIPSAYDDEGLSSSLLAIWSAITTPGGGFVTETDRNSSYLALTSPGATTNNLWTIRQAIGNTEGDYPAALLVTAKLALSAYIGSPNVGISLGDNASLSAGNFVNMALAASGTARSASAFDGALTSITLPVGTGTIYLHYQRNTAGSNNVRIYYSYDGIGWTRFYIGSKTWNVDYLFAFFQGSGAAAEPSLNLIDWIRVNDMRFLQNE